MIKFHDAKQTWLVTSTNVRFLARVHWQLLVFTGKPLDFGVCSNIVVAVARQLLRDAAE